MKIRFAIRDLLWLTVVVALALGWWVDGRARGKRYEELAHSASVQETRRKDMKIGNLEDENKWLSEQLRYYKNAVLKTP